LIAVFVFSGFEIIGVPAGEIINPQKTLPRGLLAGTITTILIYFLIQVVAVANPPDLASARSPIAETASTFLGAQAGKFITIGAVISTIGTMLALVLAGPRILFAMAVQNQMPELFGKIHQRFRTPHIAIFLFTVTAGAIAISGKFAGLATLSAMARLMTYIGSAAALLMLRRSHPSPRTFRLPGGPVLPVLVIGISFYLLSAATNAQWIAGLITVAAGLLLYGIARFAK